MIKCLAEQVLGFKNGKEKAETKLGFCELPNWVGETPYFKSAVKCGLIRAFEGNNPQTSEEILKAAEKLAALNLEIKAAEEKRDSLQSKVQTDALVETAIKGQEIPAEIPSETPTETETPTATKSKK